MKIRKIVKRLAAVGTGVAMLGATAMGALAVADLNTYPNMFVTDGTFNGFLVVGANAKPIDNLAMTDIVAGMKYVKAAATAAATTTVEGDAWKVATSTKDLELGENALADTSVTGETIQDIQPFITSDELDALADGEWATNSNTFTYKQYLYFDESLQTSSIVKYTENDEEVTGDFFYIANGRNIARYRMEFTSTAQSDVTDADGVSDTTGQYLNDFEDTKLTILGKVYNVVEARRPSGTQGSVKLTLMAGSSSDSLQELESKTYTVNGKEYDVTLSFVDSTHAKFVVNGESTAKIRDGETYVLADGSEVGVSSILYQNYAGGIHSADFFVGAEKIELTDTAVATATSSNELRVGSEDIDGAQVYITGTDNNVTFTITTIEVNMTAQDVYFTPANGKLSDVITAAGDENELLMNGLFDIEYKGLTTAETHDIKLKTSSSRRYEFELYDGDNNKVELPIAYADAQYNLSFGKETVGNGANTDKKSLVLTEGTNIYKNDYFVLTSGDATSGAAKSYLLQYQGADNSDKTNPKIKFKNIGSGETLEYSTTSSGTVATIKLGGNSFAVTNASGTGVAFGDDYQIDVDLDGAGLGTNTVVFVDYYGAQFNITHNTTTLWAALNSTMFDWINVTQTTPNSNNYDSMAPGVISMYITATSGPEVLAAFTIDGGDTLLALEGESTITYGYTHMGTFIKYEQPSSDPDLITLTYPKKEILPQLYVTSGKVKSSTSATGGTLTAVSVVDATKLDSEITDYKAENLIVVGGPCVNTVAAQLLGSPAVCTEGFTPGKARVKLFENGEKVAMLVAGYSGADTRLAGSVIAHRYAELFGTEVEIEGTTSTDATITAPTVAAAATTTTTTE